MTDTSRDAFSRIIDRTGGDSLKWNRYAGRDILPMWVADMDFAAPPAVLAAVQKRVAQGILGYAEVPASLVKTVLAHLQTKYGWVADADWLVWLPGLVTGLNVACRAVEGDVLSATPVYPPFLSAPRLAGRQLLPVPLRLEKSLWAWDWPALEAAVTPQTRLLLLCHPHNPVGRAWREEELQTLAAFAQRHGLIVCSDEIHCDLLLDPGLVHRPFAALSPDAAQRSITLMAPSKTFNIPGLGCAFALIPDSALRRQFRRIMRGIVPDINVLGLAACEAAYQEGDDWHQGLIETLRSNRDLLESAVAGLAGVAMTHVEATYLAWLDVRELKLPDPVTFFEEAGLGLSNGADFGLPGWMRLNFACPQPILLEALERMRIAVQTRLTQV